MFSCLGSLYFLITCKAAYKQMDSLCVLQVSTHGSMEEQILVWKYPRMSRLATLASHSSGMHYLAVSPDRKTIVTGSRDESLRLWNVFSKAHSPKVSAQFIQCRKNTCI
jgi:WD40 repeat protein